MAISVNLKWSGCGRQSWPSAAPRCVNDRVGKVHFFETSVKQCLHIPYSEFPGENFESPNRSGTEKVHLVRRTHAHSALKYYIGIFQREESQPTKRPPAGSFAIQGSWPEVCSNCEKGVYLKLMYHCPSGDHKVTIILFHKYFKLNFIKERSLVHKDVPIHPVIKIEIPTKFITVRESDDVSTPPKIFDFGKISM